MQTARQQLHGIDKHMLKKMSVGHGLAAAAAAQFLSFLFAGAGEGWVSPLYFSAIMWVTMPLLCYRFRANVAETRKWLGLDLCVFLSGLCLDAALFVATKNEIFSIGQEVALIVFSMTWPFILPWVALWLLWQVAALVLVARGLLVMTHSRP